MTHVLLSLVLSQAVNPYVVTARRLVRELKFADAIVQLQLARQVPNLPPRERIEALELLAKCFIAEGQRAAAEEALVDVLTFSPSHELDRATTSPKILDIFDAVKGRLFPGGKVSLREEEAPEGRIRLRVVDPFRRVGAIELRSRGDAEEWTSTPLAVHDERVEFSVPAAVEPVQWYVRALDASKETLATVGSEEAPRRSAAVVTEVTSSSEAAARPSLVAGIVASVGAVLAIAFASALQLNAQAVDRAARLSSSPPGDWADTARATHDSAVTQARWSVGLFVGGGIVATAAAVLFAW